MARATSPERLERLLERVWPGHPIEKSGEEHMVVCPFCDTSKNKCAINPKKGVFQCWVCGERGPVLKMLLHLHNLNIISQTDIDAIRSTKGNVELSSTIKEYKVETPKMNVAWSEHSPCVFPPKTYAVSGFRPHNTFEGNMHRAVVKYLGIRGMDMDDIETFRMHFCYDIGSPFHAHVFFPALGELGKQLVFWTTRSIMPNANPKSLHASRKYSRFSAKQILMNQHLIVGPKVAVCEGPFDAFSIIKATGIAALPLLGKQLHLYHRSYLESKGVKEVYLCLDSDAQDDQDKLARALVEIGIKPLHVTLEDGDPNSISQEKLYAAFKNAAYKRSNPIGDICKKLPVSSTRT